MSLHITCSECFTTTHLPANMLDRKVRCRHCRVIFLVRDVLDDDESVLTAQALDQDHFDAPRRRSTRRPLEDEDDEPPPARRRQASRVPTVVIGIVVGGLLGLVAAGVAAVLILQRPQQPQFRAGPVAPRMDPIPLPNLMPGVQPIRGRPVNVPPLPAAEQVEPGVVVHKVSLGSGANPRKVLIYLPAKPAGRLPVVLIAPAGSPLVLGMDLSSGDVPEHLPYVRAGFAVIAYSLDGNFPNFERLPPFVWLSSVRTFMQADCGVENARLALDNALSHVSALDPQRIYTAGHSSAATLSLLVAEHEPRIKACIAYAPVSNIAWKQPNANLIRQLDQMIPGCADCFFKQWSPIKHTGDLHCPVFLFHAQDDSVVPIQQSDAFAAKLRKTNAKLTYVRAQGGNHYNSMIQDGIPQAIAWLKQQAGM